MARRRSPSRTAWECRLPALVPALPGELLPLPALARQLGGVRIRWAALDRRSPVLVGILDRLALDRDRAVGVALERGRTELAFGPLVVTVVALGPTVGHVLRLVGRPVLEVRRRLVAVLQLLHGLLRALVGLLGLACLALGFARLRRLQLLGVGFVDLGHRASSLGRSR